MTTPDPDLTCAAVPVEVTWLADWLSPAPCNDDAVVLCEGGVVERGVSPLALAVTAK